MEKVKNLTSKFINSIMDCPFIYMRKLKTKSTQKIFKKLRGKAGISVRILNLRRFFIFLDRILLLLIKCLIKIRKLNYVIIQVQN